MGLVEKLLGTLACVGQGLRPAVLRLVFLGLGLAQEALRLRLGLTGALQAPHCLAQDLVATRAGRIQHREELDRLVAGWTEQHTARQVMHFLQREGVPAGMVQSCEDLFHDYHLRARGHIALVNNPSPWGPFEMRRLPAIFSATPGDSGIPTPALGRHDEEVYCGLLGLSLEEVPRLQEAKVIH